VGRNFSDFNNLAILHYIGAPDGDPTVDPTVEIPVSTLPLVETNLHVSPFSMLRIYNDANCRWQPLVPTPVVSIPRTVCALPLTA
jgi:hypothetical protein